MPRQVKASMTVGPQEFPAGTAFTTFRFKLSRPGVDKVAEDTVLEVVFNDCEAGDWVASVEALGTNPEGEQVVLGAASTTVRVEERAPVTISVPVSLNVEVLP